MRPRPARAKASSSSQDQWELEASDLAARIVREGPTRRPDLSGARVGTCRLASSLVFVTLFFAGAALSAGAGETLAELAEGGTETEATSTEDSTTAEDGTTEETTTSEGEATEPVAIEPAPPEDSADAPASPPEPPAAPVPPTAAPVQNAPPNAPQTELELETQDGRAATVWLYRTLPDPIRPAARLSPVFARMLRSTATSAGAD
jgi:hypothetical protein